MTVDNSSAIPRSNDEIGLARTLVREATWAGLGTLDRQTGAPFVSLVQVACDREGSLLLLLSELARHTLNLHADPRASLLIDRRGPPSEGAAVPRLTVLGTAAVDSLPGLREIFVARHPDAQAYASFGDFHIWRLTADVAHLVAGFGRILTFPAARLAG